MQKYVHYVIDGERVSEDKAFVRRALKQGAKVTKVVRVVYQTGPTRAMMSTVTEITKSKEV
jgi:hypothetical protein